MVVMMVMRTVDITVAKVPFENTALLAIGV